MYFLKFRLRGCSPGAPIPLGCAPDMFYTRIKLKTLSCTLLTKYCEGYKIEKNEMGWACCTNGIRERCSQGVVLETTGNEPLGRPRRRWEDNIKIGLGEVGGLWGLDGVGSG
jgi:hypothetical protein